ncbi:fused MFS/spermidine synthase, partial [Nocardioides salarius]
RLGLETGPDLEVRVEDGRLGIERLDDAAYDVVVGDAFGGLSVPWHLTTLEAVREVRRVLVDDGAYVQNLIDRGPLAFARAELATLDAVFEHVALLADPATLAREDGGNLVALASPAPLDLEQVQAGLDERGTGWGLLTGADLREWVDGAEVLTDDHAPVDQLLTPYG